MMNSLEQAASAWRTHVEECNRCRQRGCSTERDLLVEYQKATMRATMPPTLAERIQANLTEEVSR